MTIAERLALFDRLYPFRLKRYARERYLDLHSGLRFGMTQFGIIRFRGRNLLVSPDYLATGGMAVDMVFG